MKTTLLVLCFALLTQAFAEQAVWQPAKTWVFAVGVLQFKGKSKPDWPQAGRVDEVMLSTLRKRGVPPDHIVFLKDEEATLANLRQQFTQFLSRPKAGDMLIFYYAGHGGRDYGEKHRPVRFVPYDARGWEMSEVLSLIEANFAGKLVLLTADCCHSGGLAEEAARADGNISYGTLTSARSSATSTGAWTFTQCLVDLYSAKPELDLNRDGDITFGEAAQYADLKMAFRENQRSTNAVTGDFPSDMVFAQTDGAAAGNSSEKLEGFWKGKWYPAQIISAEDGKYRVTWPGFDASYESWVQPEELRPAGRALLAKDTPVEIQWGKEWYKGKVVRSALGLLLVHYDGYPDTDNEWVPMKRIRSAR